MANVLSEKSGAVLSGLARAVESVPKYSGRFFNGVAHGAGMFGPTHSPQARAERARRDQIISDTFDQRQYAPRSIQEYSQYLDQQHPNTVEAAEVVGEAALIGGLAKQAGVQLKKGMKKRVAPLKHKVAAALPILGLSAAQQYAVEPAIDAVENHNRTRIPGR